MKPTVAMMNALGAAQPPPKTAQESLNSIAAIGAAPVTMQNSTCGKPSALRASPCVGSTTSNPP